MHGVGTYPSLTPQHTQIHYGDSTTLTYICPPSHSHGRWRNSEGYELFGPQSSTTGSNGNEAEEGEQEDGTDLGKGYDYLLSMKLWSLTLEKVRKGGWFIHTCVHASPVGAN